MKKLFIALAFCLSTVILQGQSEKQATKFNFGFETYTPDERLPDGWFNWGSGYDLVIDTVEKKSGKVSMRIQPTGEITEYDVGSIGYRIPAGFMGHELELRAYMKFVDVTDRPVYLGVIAVDSSETTLARAHNRDENIKGTSDWTLYSVKMNVPENAATIYIGAALTGKGRLWIDDFQLVIDGKEIKYVE